MNYFRLITCLLLSMANPFCELTAVDDEANTLNKVSNTNIDDAVVKNSDDQEKQKRDIRIQFEGVPYTDALQRFS